jgi:hypothetical protein
LNKLRCRLGRRRLPLGRRQQRSHLLVHAGHARVVSLRPPEPRRHHRQRRRRAKHRARKRSPGGSAGHAR